MKQIVHIITILATLFAASHIQAQTLTLNDAISYALDNNPDYLVRRIVMEENRELMKKEISTKMPELTLQTGTQRNFIIAATPIPAKLINPDAPEDKIYAAPFGTKVSGFAGINFKYDIFNPDRYGNIAVRKIKSSIDETDTENSRRILIATVCLDYAAAAIASHQVELCRLDTTHSAQVLEYIRSRKAGGRASEEEYIAARQDKILSETRLIQAENIFGKSKATLLADMGKDINDDSIAAENLVLNCDIEDIVSEMEELTGTVQITGHNTADQLRTELKRQETVNSRMRMIPTISLIGYAGSNFYSDRYTPFNLNNWYGNCYLGIQISYPLTALSTKIFAYRNSKLEYREAMARMNGNTIRRAREIDSYDNDIRSYRQEMGLRKENMELAALKYETMEARFDEGQIHPAELTSALYDMRKARADYLECVYNYFTATANRQIAALKVRE